MKIRNNFVSNSSSSSFIVGKEFDLQQVKDIMTGIENQYPELAGTYEIKETGSADYGSWNEYYHIPKSCITVEDIRDNGIPYDSWDEIEEQLQAYRIHLG